MTTAATPILALPYPLGDDPVRNGDNMIRALAERLELLMAPAWITAGFVPGAGWTLSTARGKLLPGSLAMLDVVATRTGAAFTSPANGNLTNQLVVTLPAAFRIGSGQVTPFFWTSNTGGGGGGQIFSSGNASLADNHPTNTVSTGDVIYFQTVYPLI